MFNQLLLTIQHTHRKKRFYDSGLLEFVFENVGQNLRDIYTTRTLNNNDEWTVLGKREKVNDIHTHFCKKERE